MKSPFELLQEIQGSYKSVTVMAFCKGCFREGAHTKATCIIPATGDTAMTIECNWCQKSQTTIIPINDSEEN